jgi:hypothetical protein
MHFYISLFYYIASRSDFSDKVAIPFENDIIKHAIPVVRLLISQTKEHSASIPTAPTLFSIVPAAMEFILGR